MLLIHVAVFLFGAAAVVAKLTTLDAGAVVSGRTFFGSLTMLLVVARSGLPFRNLTRRQGIGLMLLGVLLAAHWFAFFQAVLLASVAVGLITFATFPFFVLVLEPFVLPVQRRWRDGLYAGGILVGVALVIPQYDFSNNLTAGAMWGLGSGLSFAVLQLINRRFVQGVSAEELALGQIAGACVASQVLFGSPDLFAMTSVDWLWLVVLGVFCTALAHTLFIGGLRTVSAGTASIIAGMEPVYGIVLAAMLLGEIPAARTLLGGAIVLSVVIAATRHTACGAEGKGKRAAAPPGQRHFDSAKRR